MVCRIGSRAAVPAAAAAAAAAAVALALALAGGSARAELLEVRQIAGGMECPECARGLRLLIKEIAGVEAAETSWNRRVLTVRFRARNRATLAQVRAAVVRQHFQAREAEIVVSGRLTDDLAGGSPSLRVSGSELSYRIDLTGRDASWRRQLGALAGAEVIVTGRVPGSALADDPLVLFPIEVQRARSPARNDELEADGSRKMRR